MALFRQFYESSSSLAMDDQASRVLKSEVEICHNPFT